MSTLAAFLWGTGAGCAVSLLDCCAIASVPRRQRRVDLADPAYLLRLIGHPVIGGFLASAYAASRADATPLVAVILGAAAPGIWRTIVQSSAAIARFLLGRLSDAH